MDLKRTKECKVNFIENKHTSARTKLDERVKYFIIKGVHFIIHNYILIHIYRKRL